MWAWRRRSQRSPFVNWRPSSKPITRMDSYQIPAFIWWIKPLLQIWHAISTWVRHFLLGIQLVIIHFFRIELKLHPEFLWYNFILRIDRIYSLCTRTCISYRLCRCYSRRFLCRYLWYIYFINAVFNYWPIYTLEIRNFYDMFLPINV